MSNPTLAQGNQILNLILQQQISKEGFQRLVETGLLADVLKCTPDQVDRDRVKAALGLFPKFLDFKEKWYLEVDQVTSPSKVLADGGWVTQNPKVNFSDGKSNLLSLGFHEYRLISFPTYKCEEWIYPARTGYSYSIFNIRLAIEGYGFTNGNLRALLAVAQAPTFPLDKTVVALGTEFSRWGGDVGWTEYPFIKEGRTRLLYSNSFSSLELDRLGGSLHFLVSR